MIIQQSQSTDAKKKLDTCLSCGHEILPPTAMPGYGYSFCRCQKAQLPASLFPKRSEPVVDPRLLQIATWFKEADERGKELIFRQVKAMPCRKECG
jgi:hypothetical protein